MKRTFLEWVADSRHYFLITLFTFALGIALVGPSVRSNLAPAPVANAGPDRTAFVNETLSLDGTGSSDVFDGWRPNSDQHAIKWSFGYGGWTYMGGLTAPVAYPEPGVYTVTLTVCNASDVCASDTATVTVSAITEGSQTIVGDSGNPVTNGTNLCNAISSLAGANNPVIVVTTGVIYRRPPSSPCLLPNRTGSGYLTIRSSALASLPGGSSRVFPSDAGNMAIMETGVHLNNSSLNSSEAIFRADTGVNPGHHYRFVGLHFRKTFPSLDYVNPRAFVDLGLGSPISLAELPHHIQIDRCFFDGGSATAGGTTRGVALSATDSAVVNSYIHRVQGIAIEVQGIWIGAGERLNVMNNFIRSTSENMLFGGADSNIRDEQGTAQSTGNDSTHIKLSASASGVNDFYKNKGIYINSGTGAIVTSPCCSNLGRVITAYDGATKIATIEPAWNVVPDGTSVYRIGSHVPTDVVIRRNHMPKDPCWRSGEACYYGNNHVVKNIFEIKQGERVSVEGNLFTDHWMEDQNWAIVFTTRNQNGRQPWSRIHFVDFSHNKVFRVGNAFQYINSDNPNPSLNMSHVIVRHTIVSGVSHYEGVGNGFRQFAHMESGGAAASMMGDKISFIRNSSDHLGFGGKGRTLEFENSTRWRSLTFSGNIVQGYFRQALAADGAAALAAATGGGTGSYSATKNGFHTSSGILPADNTTVTALGDIRYTDITNHNLKLLNTSPVLTTGLVGGRAGADTDAVDVLTAGTVTGVWTAGSICRWSTIPPCQ